MMQEIDLIITKYITGEATPEEETRLLNWLHESKENQSYFRSVKDAYDLGQAEYLFALSQTEAQWQKMEQRISPVRDHGRVRRIGLAFMRYAAVFILGLLCYMVASEWSRAGKEVLYTRIETGVGERSRVTLPDGSVVWVNSCSVLDYDTTFGETERPVRLQGEAWFEVNKDTERPFLVKAGLLTYRVTGTSFNVYSFDDENEAKIALLEGGVNVEFHGNSVKLSPGEMFSYNKTTGNYARREIDVDKLSSWRSGELFFENMPFEELTRKLERAFNVKFIVENERIKKETFSGTFHNYDSLDTILKVLTKGTNKTRAQFVTIENKVYVR